MCNFELIPHKNNVIKNERMATDNMCSLLFFEPGLIQYP